MKYRIEKINNLYHLLNNKGYTVAVSLTKKYLRFINNKNRHTRRREEEVLKILHDIYKEKNKHFFIEFNENRYSNITYDQVFVRLIGIGVVKKDNRSYIRVLLEKKILENKLIKPKKEYYLVSIHALPYNASNFVYNMLTSNRYCFSTFIDNVQISPLKYLVTVDNQGKSLIGTKSTPIFS